MVLIGIIFLIVKYFIYIYYPLFIAVYQTFHIFFIVPFLFLSLGTKRTKRTKIYFVPIYSRLQLINKMGHCGTKRGTKIYYSE